MSDDTKEWDGIAKYRYTDDENGKAIFDATDEIHDELRELIKELRSHDLSEHAMFNEGQHQAADELERVLDE